MDSQILLSLMLIIAALCFTGIGVAVCYLMHGGLGRRGAEELREVILFLSIVGFIAVLLVGYWLYRYGVIA